MTLPEQPYPRVRNRWYGLGGRRHEYPVLELSETEAWRVRDVEITARGELKPIVPFVHSFAPRLRTFTRCDPETAEATRPAEHRALDIGTGLEWQTDADLAAQFARAEPWTPPSP